VDLAGRGWGLGRPARGDNCHHPSRGGDLDTTRRRNLNTPKTQTTHARPTHAHVRAKNEKEGTEEVISPQNGREFSPSPLRAPKKLPIIGQNIIRALDQGADRFLREPSAAQPCSCNHQRSLGVADARHRVSKVCAWDLSREKETVR